MKIYRTIAQKPIVKLIETIKSEIRSHQKNLRQIIILALSLYFEQNTSFIIYKPPKRKSLKEMVAWVPLVEYCKKSEKEQVKEKNKIGGKDKVKLGSSS